MCWRKNILDSLWFDLKPMVISHQLGAMFYPVKNKKITHLLNLTCDRSKLLPEADYFSQILESRVCCSWLIPVPCSALFFYWALNSSLNIQKCKKDRTATRVCFTGPGVLLPDCPSRWKTAAGKLNLAEGGIFRLPIIWNQVAFLAGNTPEERTKRSDNTQVLLSKIKSYAFGSAWES